MSAERPCGTHSWVYRPTPWIGAEASWRRKIRACCMTTGPAFFIISIVKTFVGTCTFLATLLRAIVEGQKNHLEFRSQVLPTPELAHLPSLKCHWVYQHSLG
ncbi:hypothetical protein ATANTOWER_018492 [Ataeniobius toweri]|uniref:Uncharacterized protein n=1 Tax=Ataeniobius toweri TaxID=208326 RepID=A0ABU7BGB9_9TELE|nr:hypothetical protein [Ataeniobius toweri]